MVRKQLVISKFPSDGAKVELRYFGSKSCSLACMHPISDFNSSYLVRLIQDTLKLRVRKTSALELFMYVCTQEEST